MFDASKDGGAYRGGAKSELALGTVAVSADVVLNCYPGRDIEFETGWLQGLPGAAAWAIETLWHIPVEADA